MYYEFRCDLDLFSQDALSDWLSSGGYYEYLVSYEIASSTGKPHWQGWVAHGLNKTTWYNRTSKFFKSFGLNDTQYARAECREPEVYQSYILKNVTKTLTHVVTDIDIDERLLLLQSFVPYSKKPKKAPADKKPRFIDILIQKLKDDPLIHCSSQLSYSRLADRILDICASETHVVDKFILKRLYDTSVLVLEKYYGIDRSSHFKSLKDYMML